MLRAQDNSSMKYQGTLVFTTPSITASVYLQKAASVLRKNLPKRGHAFVPVLAIPDIL